MRRDLVQQREVERQSSGLAALGAVLCAVMIVAGCAAQRKRAIPWATAIQVRPAAPQDNAVNEEAAAPDLEVSVSQPEPVFVPRSGPVRPRTYTPTINREAHSEKPETPQIVPELSAKESGELQRETEQSLSDAERNIAAAAQKTLNATQSDLASKVRGFIADARGAGKIGDWSRARDLAKKAQVLSEELASSL
jgi:hypothetical protein